MMSSKIEGLLTEAQILHVSLPHHRILEPLSPPHNLTIGNITHCC